MLMDYACHLPFLWVVLSLVLSGSLDLLCNFGRMSLIREAQES